MSDEPGRLKEVVTICFASMWRQYTGALLRLSEAELLVTSLIDRYVGLKDKGLMGVSVGRGKKKQPAVDEVVASPEAQLSEAELLRFNLVFQLQTFCTDMLDAVRMSQRVVHVWLPEVEELYTWYRTGGKEPASACPG